MTKLSKNAQIVKIMDNLFISKNHTCLKVDGTGKKSIRFYMLTTTDKWTREENEITLTKKEVLNLIDFLKTKIE